MNFISVLCFCFCFLTLSELNIANGRKWYKNIMKNVHHVHVNIAAKIEEQATVLHDHVNTNTHNSSPFITNVNSNSKENIRAEKTYQEVASPTMDKEPLDYNRESNKADVIVDESLMLSASNDEFVRPCCDTLKDSITTINGQDLPFHPTRSKHEVIALHTVDKNKGMESFIMKTTRAAGTRSVVHVHEYEGKTCLVEGEMTLYLQNSEPTRKTVGECYHMPSELHMSGVNTGSTDAVMFDMFTVPIDAPVWIVLEKGVSGIEEQFAM
jgi:hypothetical protein